MINSNHKWDKVGLIYSLDGSTKNKFLLTHSSNPTAVEIKDGLFRIFSWERCSKYLLFLHLISI